MDLERMSRQELIDALRALRQGEAEAADHGREAARLLRDLEAQRADLELQNRELREARGALEQSRDRFRELYDFAPVAYFTFDAHGRVQEVNLTGATMVGRDRERILGLPFLDLVRMQAPSVFWEHLERCAERGRPVVSEMQIALPRAGVRDVQVATAPVLGAAGEPVAFRTSFTDVTRRTWAEVALDRARRREESLRKGFEALDHASTALSRVLARPGGPGEQELLQIIADEARKIAEAEYALFCFPGAEDAPFATCVPSGTALSLAERIGRPPRPRGVLGEVVRTGRTLRVDDLRAHPAFEGFPAHHPAMRSFLGVPVRYADRVVGQLFLANRRWADAFSDEDQRFVELFAERAGIALQIARLGEEVRSAVRARDDVLAIVSHDLRNPLAAIRLSAAQLARRLRTEDAAQRKKLDVIERAAERMVRLIADLLDAATIERGTFTIDPRPESIAPILDEALQAHEAMAAARSLRLRRDVPADLPPILCDRQRLLQVLANLLGNAVKFVHEGGLVEVRARAEDGGVRFEVADDGPGIPEEQAARLFERYWKGHREEREGVGLGLFIARGIVEAHGGALRLTSTPGAGSTFHFTIPIAREREPTTRPPPPP